MRLKERARLLLYVALAAGALVLGVFSQARVRADYDSGGWTDYEKREVIALLKQIEKNTR